MSPSIKNIFMMISIAVIIGGTSGILASSFTDNYLAQYASSLNELTQPIRIAQEKPRAIPQTYELALDKIRKISLPSVGALFGATIPYLGFAENDKRSGVVAMTSDGWMLSGAGALSSTVSISDKTCAVDKSIKDNATGIYFLHCDINGLPVVDFGDGYSLKPGDQIFISDGPHRLFFTQIVSVDWGGVSARSSDTPARRFTISENFNLLPGAVAFNLSGEIIGVVDASSNGKSFIPFEHLSGAFKSVLGGSEKINRAALGVRFVDLARAVGLQDARSRFLRSGALVAGSPAVKWGSAAHTAGILAGDIILAIDGVNIDADRSLDDLVATYSPGDKARVLVDRDSEHLDLDVTFGTAFE